MSQAKVDRYKEEKANRKKNQQKEKMRQILRRSVIGVISLVLIGWLGYSAYNIYDSGKPVTSAEVDYSAVTDYQNALYVTE